METTDPRAVNLFFPGLRWSARKSYASMMSDRTPMGQPELLKVDADAWVSSSI